MARAVIIIGMLAAVASGGWYGYSEWFNAPVEVTYKTAEVERGDVVQTASATGTIEPLVKVLVGTEVSGTIIKWYADFNAEVKQGQVLVELDQERFKAVLQMRKAAAAVAKARAEEARANLNKLSMDRERIEKASKRGAATDFEIRTARADEAMARAAVNAAEAQFQAAEADVQQAQVELDKTVIRSPIDGVVISRDVDEGQTVAAAMNTPTLFTIANDLTKMRVNAAVSEMDIGKVREGMKAEFEVDAYPDRTFEGVVSQVRYAEKVESGVVTYTTLISVDNPDLALRPGMTARIEFEVDRADDVIKVPNGALRFVPKLGQAGKEALAKSDTDKNGKPGVFILQHGKPERVEVELGLNDGKFTQVTSGNLEPGQQVITAEETPGSRRKQR